MMMMMIRWSKIVLVTAVALYCVLAAFGNMTDYSTNLLAVQQTLSMKDIFPNSTIAYRAIINPVIHNGIYMVIISLESLSGLLCMIGAWNLFKAIKKEATVFNNAKKWAIAGLTLGFLTWQVSFMSIGGEWFGMWMSPMLNNALHAAFQIFITLLGILIFVAIKDE